VRDRVDRPWKGLQRLKRHLGHVFDSRVKSSACQHFSCQYTLDDGGPTGNPVDPGRSPG
jgi:hypothetical protein